MKENMIQVILDEKFALKRRHIGQIDNVISIIVKSHLHAFRKFLLPKTLLMVRILPSIETSAARL